MIDDLHALQHNALCTHGSCTCGTKPREELCAFCRAIQAYEIRKAVEDAGQKERRP